MEKLHGEVVTLLTVAGEIVGRLKSTEGDTIIIEDPRLIMQSSETTMGFAPGYCMSGEVKPTEGVFFKGTLVSILKTSDDISKEWVRHTSGIILQ